MAGASKRRPAMNSRKNVFTLAKRCNPCYNTNQLSECFVLKKPLATNRTKYRCVTRGFLVQIAQRNCPLQLKRSSVTIGTLEARQECYLLVLLPELNL